MRQLSQSMISSTLFPARIASRAANHEGALSRPVSFGGSIAEQGTDRNGVPTVLDCADFPCGSLCEPTQLRSTNQEQERFLNSPSSAICSGVRSTSTTGVPSVPWVGGSLKPICSRGLQFWESTRSLIFRNDTLYCGNRLPGFLQCEGW
jgi:hypothetical protein